jgi:hypothetical protein
MNKVKLQILKQVNDHVGPCKETFNEYSEALLNHITDVPKEYENYDVGYVILSHKWEKELEEIKPKVNEGDTRTCYIGGAGKYDMGIHDYKLTVINAIIIKQ